MTIFSLRRFAALFALVLFASTRAAHAEFIRSFDSEVRLRADTSLDVKETIHMDFEGAQRHGIYRKIPIVYDRRGGKYSLYVKVQEVTIDGAPATYSQSTQGRELSLRVGDPDRTITGAHLYVFRYNVRRAVNFFDGGQPEVYWNATGNEWPYDMKQASARFFPPPGVTVDQLRADCFVGPPGSTRTGSIEKEAGSLLFSTSNLQPGDGLTFVVRAPAGSVTPPSALQNIAWFLADWWPLIFFPLFTAVALFMVWRRTGRDIEGGQAIAVEWNPPKELSPAEVGTLIDERCDMQDIIATLIDLAARGYLVIQETKSTKVLFLSSTDYTFIRTRAEDDGSLDNALAPHESKFLKGIFGSADFEKGSERVTLSSLKEKFYSHLPGIRNSIYAQMMTKNCFTSNPETTRQSYSGIGALLVIGGIAGVIFGLSILGTISYGLGLVISGVFVLMSAGAMPAKTARGSRLLRECQGFQRFIQMAEKDRIRVLAQDDPTIFGRLLPYAMVLGVADQWAEKFQGLMTQPPDWYVGGGFDNFSTYLFVNSLSSGMNTMGSTFSSTPAPVSEAGGGGSGFSSGGGFSGGGFGGGGGGSW